MFSSVTDAECKKNGTSWQALLFLLCVGAAFAGEACSGNAKKVKTVAAATEPPVVLTIKSDALACGALSDQIAGLLGPSNAAAVRVSASQPSNFEPAVISALAMCEQALIKTKAVQMGGASMVDTLAQSTADPEEVSGYAALLTRYAQQGGMRRWLYYGPKLAKLFQSAYDRRVVAQHCGRTVREFSYFLETAPPPLGGDSRRGMALHKSECEVVSGEEDRRIPDLERRHPHLLSQNLP